MLVTSCDRLRSRLCCLGYVKEYYSSALLRCGSSVGMCQEGLLLKQPCQVSLQGSIENVEQCGSLGLCGSFSQDGAFEGACGSGVRDSFPLLWSVPRDWEVIL